MNQCTLTIKIPICEEINLYKEEYNTPKLNTQILGSNPSPSPFLELIPKTYFQLSGCDLSGMEGQECTLDSGDLLIFGIIAKDNKIYCVDMTCTITEREAKTIWQKIKGMFRCNAN